MSNPTFADLVAAIDGLRFTVLSLEGRLTALEPAGGARIGAASVSMTPTSSPPIPSTKGKARAKAAPAPSKAKPAKKERPTKKATIPSENLPLHLAQTFPQEGKPDRHLVTVAIPDATAAHVIGQGGKGLKQLHDISGARVSAYTITSGPRDERHVSIRGTDEQIGDALVVLGKRMARKRVRGPTTKKTVPELTFGPRGEPLSHRVVSKPRSGPAPSSSGSKPSSSNFRDSWTGSASSGFPGPSATWGASTAGPPPGPELDLTPATSFHSIPLLPPSPSQSYPSITVSQTPSRGEQSVSPGPPSVVMASPSPTSTPRAPTGAMSSPSSATTAASSPMHVDAVRTGQSATPRRQTARRGGGPPLGT